MGLRLIAGEARVASSIALACFVCVATVPVEGDVRYCRVVSSPLCCGVSAEV